MAYTIKGDAGEPLDATARTLEGLNIEAGTLRLASLASDTLAWTARTLDATGAGTIVPSIGQMVELWQDTTRRFRGHVTSVKVGMNTVAITAEGPWWWLLRTPLTSSQADSAGTLADRASYVFPTQTLQTSLAAIAARAIAQGVPMAYGACHTLYTVPNMTLSEMSCAAAIAELMTWAPDAVAWFDYSGTGLPVLNIHRRGSMPTLTATVGQDVEELDISPRLDLEVGALNLTYVTRNPTTGRPLWASQSSGGAGVAGKRQIITVSGPEIVDFLPRDDFDSVQVQTGVVANAFVAARDSKLAGLVKEFGTVGGMANTLGTWKTSNGMVSYDRTLSFPPLRYFAADGSEITSLGTRKLVLNDVVLPDWAVKHMEVKDVRITGTWMATTTAIYAAFDNWRESATSKGQLINSQGNYYWYFAMPFEISARLTTHYYAALTTVYKPWDYNFLTPPAGLADALRTAQNWTPWEGSITQVAQDFALENCLPNRIRIAGTLTECATMDALLRGVSYDIIRGRRTLELGAPARTDFGTLVGRIRREPQDNIVYL